MGWVSGSRGPLILPSCFVLNVVLDILFAGAPFFSRTVEFNFSAEKNVFWPQIKKSIAFT